MATGRNTITQRIALEGGEEVKRALDSIGQAGSKAFEDIKAAASADSGLDKAAAQAEALKNKVQEVTETTRGLGETVRSTFSEFASSAGSAASSLGSIALEIGQIGVKVAATVLGLATAATAATTALADTGSKAAQEISDAAEKLGLTTDAYQKLVFQAEAAGVSQEDFAQALAHVDQAVTSAYGSLKTLGTGAQATGQFLGDASVNVQRFGTAAKAAAAPTEATQKAVAQLGLSLAKLANMSPEERVQAIASALSKLPDGAQRSAIALELLGSNWRKVLPLFTQGDKAFSDSAKEFEASSRKLSAAQIEIGKAYQTAKADLTDAVAATKNQIGLLFAPGATQRMEWLTKLIDDTREATVAFVKLVQAKADLFIDTTFGSTGAALTFVLEKIRDISTDIAKVWNAVFSPAIKLVAAGFDFLVQKMNEFLGTDITGRQVVILALLGSLTGAFALLKLAINPAIALVSAFGTALFALAPILAPLALLVIAFWDEISSAAGTAFEFIKKKGTELKAIIEEVVAGHYAVAWEKFKQLGVDAFEAIKASGSDFGVQLTAAFKSLQAALLLVRTGLSGIAFLINGIFGTSLTGDTLAFLLIVGRLTGVLGTLRAVLGIVALTMQIVRGNFLTLGAAALVIARLMPGLSKGFDEISRGLGKLLNGNFSGALNDLKAGFSDLFTTVSGAGTGAFVILALGVVQAFRLIDGAVMSSQGRMTAWAGLFKTLTSLPFLLSTAFVAAFIIIFARFDEFKAAAIKVWEGVKKVFSGDLFSSKDGQGGLAQIKQGFQDIFTLLTTSGPASWALVLSTGILTAKLLKSAFSLGWNVVWNGILLLGELAFNGIVLAGKGAAALVRAAWLATGMAGVFSNLATSASAAFGTIGTAANGLLRGALASLLSWPALFIGAIGLIALLFVRHFDEMKAVVGHLLEAVNKLIHGDLSGAWQELKASFAGVWDIFKSDAIAAFAAVALAVGILTRTIAAALALAMTPGGLIALAVAGIVAIFIFYWDDIKKVSQAALDAIADKIKSFIERLKNLPSEIKNVGAQASSGFEDLVPGRDDIVTKWNKLWDDITSGASKAFKELVIGSAGASEAVGNAATDAATKSATASTAVAQKASSDQKTLWQGLQDIISAGIKSMAGITDETKAAGDAATDTAKKLSDAGKTIVNTWDVAKGKTRAFTVDIQKVAEDANKNLSTVGDGLKELPKKAGEAVEQTKRIIGNDGVAKEFKLPAEAAIQSIKDLSQTAASGIQMVWLRNKDGLLELRPITEATKAQLKELGTVGTAAGQQIKEGLSKAGQADPLKGVKEKAKEDLDDVEEDADDAGTKIAKAVGEKPAEALDKLKVKTAETSQELAKVAPAVEKSVTEGSTKIDVSLDKVAAKLTDIKRSLSNLFSSDTTDAKGGGSLFKPMEEAADKLVTGLKNKFNDLKEALRTPFDGLDVQINDLWEKIENAAKGAVERIKSAFTGMEIDFTGLTTAFDGASQKIETAFLGLASRLADILSSHLSDDLKSRLVSGGLVGLFQAVTKEIEDVFTGMVKNVGTIMADLPNKVREVAGNAALEIQKLTGSLTGASEPAQTLSAPLAFIVETLARLSGVAVSAVAGLASFVEILGKMVILTTIATAMGEFSLAWDVFGKGINDLGLTVIQTLGNFVTILLDLPPKIAPATEAVKTLPAAFDGIAPAIEKASGSFDGLTTKIATSFGPDLGTKLQSTFEVSFRTAILGVTQVIVVLFDAIVDKILTIIGKIPQGVSSVFDLVTQGVLSFSQAVTGAEQPSAALVDTMTRIHDVAVIVSAAIAAVLDTFVKFVAILGETAVLTTAAAAIGDLNQAFLNFQTGAGAAIGALILGVKDFIEVIKLLPEAIDGSARSLDKLPVAFKEAGTSAQTAGEQIVKAFADLGTKIQEALANLPAIVAGIFAQVTAAIQNAMSIAVSAVQSAASQMISILQQVEAQIRAVMAAAAQAAASGGGGGGGGGLPENAAGGYLSGPGTGTSDSFLSWVSNGEFILKAAAVRKYGLSLLYALNGMKVDPRALGFSKFASGGAVSMKMGLPAFAGGGFAGAIGPMVRALTSIGSMKLSMPRLSGNVGINPRALAPVHLHLPGGGVISGMMAPEDTARQLTRYALGQQIKSTGRKPSWYGG